jgi:hypothetical protein
MLTEGKNQGAMQHSTEVVPVRPADPPKGVPPSKQLTLKDLRELIDHLHPSEDVKNRAAGKGE